MPSIIEKLPQTNRAAPARGHDYVRVRETIAFADMWTMTLMAVPIVRRCGADWNCAMINRTLHDDNCITLAHTHAQLLLESLHIYYEGNLAYRWCSIDKWCSEKVNG